MRSAFTGIAVFRKQYSISQEDLAAYLGISYSALAMHERGERPLATTALIKFGELLMTHEKINRSAKGARPLAAIQAKLDKQQADAASKMQHIITDHRRRVQQLQHKLKAITVKQEGAPRWLRIIEEKLAGLPKTTAAKGDRQVLEVMHARACAGLLKNNEQKLKLQLTMALLEAEAAVYEAQLIALRKESKGY